MNTLFVFLSTCGIVFFAFAFGYAFNVDAGKIYFGIVVGLLLAIRLDITWILEK